MEPDTDMEMCFETVSCDNAYSGDVGHREDALSGGMDGGGEGLAASAAGAHLDTVRALHQTVVSLRTALELSKNELKELKNKYEQHSHCLDYADVIEKLTLENHILRRKIIDSGFEEPKSQNIKLQVTYSPRQNVEEYSELVINTATTDDSNRQSVDLDNRFCSTERLNEAEAKLDYLEEVSEANSEKSGFIQVDEEDINPVKEFPQVKTPAKEDSELSSNKEESEISEDNINKEQDIEDPASQVTGYARFHSDNEPTSFKTKLELLSKFDVRINVRTLKEGTIVSSTTSDSDSTIEDKREKPEKDIKTNFEFEEKREQYKNSKDQKGNRIKLKSISSENIRMAVPNEADAKAKVDKFDVQVRITSEENLVVKERVERSRRKDTLNLDVDDLSLRSMSEGDNSVFSEGGITPVDPQAAVPDDKLEDNASGNESEEVDDIELIFTTDESKDISNLQEDLVSIRESGETEQWNPSSTSTHSTPVLIKFHTLDPDFQPGKETTDNAENENQENSSLQGAIAESSLRMKRVSLPSDKDIRHVAFNGKGSLELPGRGILKSCDNKSDNMLYKKGSSTSSRRLDSVDSLTCEYNRGLSFDNTKSSSFELGSSMDILHREESVDSFYRNVNLGHRFSVFAETDISKCGISEEDLVGNLNVRRNTCPNPFQYRPSQSRYAARGPMKVSGAFGRARPVLRETAHARRESGAQTDLSALPPRWSSDGYLAYKMPSNSTYGPTLPPRGTGRRLTVADARTQLAHNRNDDTRRILLSDIGFTSMVPELSRSADPVWALAKRPSATDSSPVSTSTSKFLSRGSSYRSPCLSIDRSNDWIPQNQYVPKADSRLWRSSLPDVRRDDTEELLYEAETFLRRSIDNLHSTSLDMDRPQAVNGQPYIPAEPKHLRLGHTVKVITPQGRIAVGRVRYVGIAGGSAANSNIVVGVEFPIALNPSLPRNDGTHRSRRYFLAAPLHTALFVPFTKVVMAWAN